MRRILGTVAVVLFVYAAFAASIFSVYTLITVYTDDPNDCSEDEMCWDCETMGNQVCGRVTDHYTYIGDNMFIEIHDERGRVVFGPVALQP